MYCNDNAPFFFKGWPPVRRVSATDDGPKSGEISRITPCHGNRERIRDIRRQWMDIQTPSEYRREGIDGYRLQWPQRRSVKLRSAVGLQDAGPITLWFASSTPDRPRAVGWYGNIFVRQVLQPRKAVSGRCPLWHAGKESPSIATSARQRRADALIGIIWQSSAGGFVADRVAET
jgi:hypothetical protein